MIRCPHCDKDITHIMVDVFRKRDESRFECPHCEKPIIGVIRHIFELRKDE